MEASRRPRRCRMKRLLAPLALAALLCATAGASADEIVLKNGRTLEGEVTESGDLVVFRRPGLSMEIRRDEVAEIRKAPTAKEQYAKKAAELDAADAAASNAAGAGVAKRDAEDRHRLGPWGGAKGPKEEAAAQHRRAVDPAPAPPGRRPPPGPLKTHPG